MSRKSKRKIQAGVSRPVVVDNDLPNGGMSEVRAVWKAAGLVYKQKGAVIVANPEGAVLESLKGSGSSSSARWVGRCIHVGQEESKTFVGDRKDVIERFSRWSIPLLRESKERAAEKDAVPQSRDTGKPVAEPSVRREEDRGDVAVMAKEQQKLTEICPFTDDVCGEECTMRMEGGCAIIVLASHIGGLVEKIDSAASTVEDAALMLSESVKSVPAAAPAVEEEPAETVADVLEAYFADVDVRELYNIDNKQVERRIAKWGADNGHVAVPDLEAVTEFVQSRYADELEFKKTKNAVYFTFKKN